MQNDHKDEGAPAREYDVLVKHNGESFTLFIPELGIIKNHQNLNEGYRELKKAEEEYFKNLKKFGAQDFLPEPNPHQGNIFKASKSNINLSGLIPFTAKAAIIIMLFFGFASISTVVLGNITSKGFSRLVNKVQASQPLNKLFANMEAVSPEAVEKQAQQVRRIGKKIQPVISELKLLWKSNASTEAILRKDPGSPLESP